MLLFFPGENDDYDYRNKESSYKGYHDERKRKGCEWLENGGDRRGYGRLRKRVV